MGLYFVVFFSQVFEIDFIYKLVQEKANGFFRHKQFSFYSIFS